VPRFLPQRRTTHTQAGLTLLELLVALTMTAVLGAALVNAYAAEVQVQQSHERRMATLDRSDSFEREITRLLSGAYLSSTATDQTTFFQGLATEGSNDLGCSRLTFTTTAPGVPPSVLTDTADDFETLQQKFGPAGGVSEVSFSTTPVGSPPAGQAGLFERLQHPSDTDTTQGGTESVLNPQVESIGFQFWDGLEWVSTWDTTTGTRRLPQAVMVSYHLADSSGTARSFVVSIPGSDVSSQNPVSTTTTSTTTTTPTGAGGGG